MAKAIKTVSTIVTRIEDVGSDTKRFTLADKDNWQLPPFRPGAHVDVHVRPGLVRTYSLCNEPEDACRYVIAVKRERDGLGGSNHLHDRVSVGDPIGVSIPRGGIGLLEDGMNVFIAGGIGVTPFLSAIRHLERNGRTNYVLHWSSRGAPSLADMIAPAIVSGRVRVYDTRNQEKFSIAEIVLEYEGSGLAACCGPLPMIEMFEDVVGSWPDDRKHIELFAPPKRVALSDVPPYELLLKASNMVATVTPDVGLLGTLGALGIDVPVSCGGGICGACRVRWIEGPPIHRDRILSASERQSELIVCVGDCAGPRLVLDL